MKPLYVTKTFLPPFEEYCELLRQIWDTHLVTNDGPFYQEFEKKLKEYTKLGHLACVGNGTLALQIALHALEIVGKDVITTPFTHVSTSNCLIWERCHPVYADIDPGTLNIDPVQIEAKITPRTAAILAVHVYGNPCDVDAIADIAARHRLKVVYDGAHAFGVLCKGRSIFGYGDLSMTSFNATKGLHTVEGGALFAKDAETIRQVRKLAYFGMDERKQIVQQWGMNAKMIEFCAALGIINLRYLPASIQRRKALYERYLSLLAQNEKVRFQKLTGDINYSYMPVIFESRECKRHVLKELAKDSIYPREYFYPSLEAVFSDRIECEVASDIADRILCLPMSDYLSMEDVERVCANVNETCGKCEGVHTAHGL